ncbi:MAG: hypothetical protein JNM19_09250 [Chitinophagaceae bacterium]|nr:hypothetical protein [Chitinophagaceae bacterium]
MELTQRLHSIPEAKCKCFIPPLHYTDYEKTYWGVDTTNGRFAEITLEVCVHCGTKWLNYLVEYEAFSKSGRWYRGVVQDNNLKGIVPGKVVSYFEGLDWFIFGGSYFSSTGMYGKGKVQADL